MILTDEHKSLLLSVGIHLICFLIFSGTAWHAYEQMKKGDQHIYVVGIQGGGAGKPAGAPAAAPKSGPGVPPPPAAPVKPDDLTDPALPERPLPETASPISTHFDNRQSDTVPTADKAAGTGTSAGDGAGTEGDGQGQGGTGSGDGTGMGSGEGSGEGAGPGFDTDAIQPDVTPTFLGGSGAVYPEPLRNRGITGRVVVRMTVGKDGSVEAADVISSSGYGLMDQAALDAAYTYSFSPAYKEGYTVRCYATKAFSFQLR